MGSSRLYKEIASLLNTCRGVSLSIPERIEKTIDLASLLLELTQLETQRSERFQLEKLTKMVEDPTGKEFSTAMTDQCFRSPSVRRTASQLSYLLRRYGIPRFLPPFDRFKLLLFKYLGTFLPHLFVPLAKKAVRKEMSGVLLPNNLELQKKYFEKSMHEGVRINLNHLGEAILGEKEAHRRLMLYLNDLSNPLVDYISVKVSTLYSQINLIGWESTLNTLADRLRQLYDQAIRYPIQTSEGRAAPKFVNLDMEEYQDLDLTIALFTKVLGEPRYHGLQAGIVLQSYLPDAFEKLKKLTEWSKKRVILGGAPIKLRLVKGANLSMECVESSLMGWEQTPFTSKAETDANFKKMLDYAATPEHIKAVKVGVGSHNLFDIAYTLILRSMRNVEKGISFEMLEGMAEPMRRVIHRVSPAILLYCPEASEKNFQFAISYLIRRLDENTGPEHFLRALFSLKPNSESWFNQVELFKQGCSLIDSTSTDRRRNQNRESLVSEKEPDAPFSNEPDTDFSLPENREWAKKILSHRSKFKPSPIPLLIDGKKQESADERGIDPSFPHETLYTYSLANSTQIDKALTCAKKTEGSWQATTIVERSLILAKTAHLLREKREELVTAMVADCGKIIPECDVEISEAIDFIEYYRKNWEKIETFHEIQKTPLGTILIAPPWNFPCSISVGGIAGSLIAGNCVLFKPAPETVLVGWTLVQAFWEAGVPKEVLQFIPCLDHPTGSKLIQDPRLNGVILTGATETSRLLLKLRPSLNLLAETGGKNSLIISSICDPDLAIADLIQSAFGFAGQKCSACSLAIIDAPLYDDPSFLESLRDAAASLHVGSAWDPTTKVGPLIHPPQGVLKRGITELEPGERWLLMPKQNRKNPHLFSPGIKLDVVPGSFTHQTELFGPILGLIRAETLEEALNIANGTPYGLTSGIHTLDDREKKIWKEKIVAGNLYINRGITGAIVRRQPFGGCKASCYGPGGKAGGPNYVLQLSHLKQNGLSRQSASLPKHIEKFIDRWPLSKEEKGFLTAAAQSYAYFAPILLEPVDPSGILGQENLFYHVPLDTMTLRIDEKNRFCDALAVVLACYFCKTPLIISHHKQSLDKGMEYGTVIHESEETFLSRLKGPRIRLLHPPSPRLLEAATKNGIYLIHSEILATGRFELLHYLREVSLSHTTHRYGYLKENR